MNFYKISLPGWEYPLRDGINITDYFGTTPGITRYPEDILSQPLRDDISRRGLRISEVQVFISPGPHNMKIHIDGTEIGANHCAVNWIVSKSPSWVMSWHEYIGPDLVSEPNAAGTIYMETPSEFCTTLETRMWTGPALVNTSVPHKIVNLSTTLRYCISLRFVRADGGSDFDYVKSVLI